MKKLLLFSLLVFGWVEGRQPNMNYNRLNDSLDVLDIKQNNQQAEIEMIVEKFDTLEQVIDSLRIDLDKARELRQVGANHRESIEGFDIRLAGVEATTKGMVDDVKMMKKHVNESTKALKEFRKQLNHYDKFIEVQNRNMEDMKTAIYSIMDALGLEIESPMRTYTVKLGDSLDKIARKHHTTIKKLKELNRLKNDRIIVGQNLKLP